MKFHHIGIPTQSPKAGEVFLKDFDIFAHIVAKEEGKSIKIRHKAIFFSHSPGNPICPAQTVKRKGRMPIGGSDNTS